MPSASPSRARVANVLEAIQAAGLVAGEVRVAPDGGFSITCAAPGAAAGRVDRTSDAVDAAPKKWVDER